MRSLPVPCPAHLIPVASGTDAFHHAYRQAMTDGVVFVAIESEGSRWMVNLDTLSAEPGYSSDARLNKAVQDAMIRLVRNHEIDEDAYTGPGYFMMRTAASEDRVRELAAAFHAALYGDLQPLSHAVPLAP